MVETNYIPANREATLRTRTTAVDAFRGFERPFARISWGAIFAGAIIALATQLVLTLIGTASGLASFAASNSDRVSRTQLPAAVQQQIDQLTAQARLNVDQAVAQAQQITPEQKAAEARQVGQRAVEGGAVGTGAAALGLILGALAAAFGGRTGGQYPVGEGYVEQRRTAGR